MRYLRAALALLLSATLMLPLAGCHKDDDIPGPVTMANAFFDLAVHNDAAAMCAALGPEVSEAGVRAAFLPPDYYASMSAELASQLSEMGITVSEEDAKLLADATLSMMSKIDCTVDATATDEAAHDSATVYLSVTTFPAGSFLNAATAAVAEMDLSLFLSDDLDAVYSQIIRAMADTLTGLQPSGDAQSVSVPFSLQEVAIEGRSVTLWAPNNGDEFLAQITSIVSSGLS